MIQGVAGFCEEKLGRSKFKVSRRLMVLRRIMICIGNMTLSIEVKGEKFLWKIDHSDKTETVQAMDQKSLPIRMLQIV